MQTFVPEYGLIECAAVLDNKRLGKQRVETLQILKALAGLSKGWTNHPATRMWRGYECALMFYQTAVCKEWKARGYNDTCWFKTLNVYNEHFGDQGMNMVVPPWWGDDRVHNSHKSALVFKDPTWYSKYYPDVVGEYNYYWPV